MSHVNRYDQERARFEDIPDVGVPEDDNERLTFCPSCVRLREKETVHLMPSQQHIVICNTVQLVLTEPWTNWNSDDTFMIL